MQFLLCHLVIRHSSACIHRTMLKINVLFVLLIATCCDGAPMTINEHTDISIIKHYINKGLEIGEKQNAITQHDLALLDSQKQEPVPVYFTRNRPVFYLKRRDGSSIICFPNNQCVDINDVGVHP